MVPADGAVPFGVPPPHPPTQFGMGGPPGMGPMDMEPGVMSLQELQRQATAVVAFGNVFPVIAGSNLFMSVLSGEGAVKDFPFFSNQNQSQFFSTRFGSYVLILHSIST